MPEVVRSRYPFSDDGQIRWDPNEPWYDAIVWCAAIATVTERVEIGPAVMLAGLRHPLVLAKQLASIDVLSGGRVIAGFGAGWMAEEFDALGVPFDSRGQRLDEWIDICRGAWTGRMSGVDGKQFSAGVEMITEPRPARSIPILIGGMSDAALRRIAKRADGWVPLVRGSLDPVATIERGMSRLRELAAAAGRDSVEFRVVYNAAAPRTPPPASMPSPAPASPTSWSTSTTATPTDRNGHWMHCAARSRRVVIWAATVPIPAHIPPRSGRGTDPAQIAPGLDLVDRFQFEDVDLEVVGDEVFDAAAELAAVGAVHRRFEHRAEAPFAERLDRAGEVGRDFESARQQLRLDHLVEALARLAAAPAPTRRAPSGAHRPPRASKASPIAARSPR